MKNIYFKNINSKKSKQVSLSAKRGFTLVELLLVMAIVGILAGALMMGISSSRKRARVTSALKTANGITAELADCYLNNNPVNNPNVGTQICSGAGNWPNINGCTYSGYNSNVLTIDCLSGYATITCDVAEGNCEVTY